MTLLFPFVFLKNLRLLEVVDVAGIEKGHVNIRLQHVYRNYDFKFRFRLPGRGVELIALVLAGATRDADRFS